MTNMAAMSVDSKKPLKIFSETNESMALKLDMWHWVLEYCQDCQDLGLILTFLQQGQIWKMLKLKIPWKVLKIFNQECSNDDLSGLTLNFLFIWQG